MESVKIMKLVELVKPVREKSFWRCFKLIWNKSSHRSTINTVFFCLVRFPNPFAAAPPLSRRVQALLIPLSNIVGTTFSKTDNSKLHLVILKCIINLAGRCVWWLKVGANVCPGPSFIHFFGSRPSSLLYWFSFWIAFLQHNSSQRCPKAFIQKRCPNYKGWGLKAPKWSHLLHYTIFNCLMFIWVR